VVRRQPSFGFERRGAPVASFLRLDDREIRQMTNIYNPDCILCIDPTVGRAVNIFDGVRENAVLVQTTAKPLEEMKLSGRVATVGLCDAISIALGSSGIRSPTRSCLAHSRARPAW
jgi:pyruvate ferredoxin oxidoreductase gamma subunit/phenylglyoxylate dehydrogenase gamma subunit